MYQANLIHDNGCESTESFNYTMLPPIVTGLVDPAPLCDEEVAMLSVTGNVDALSWNVGAAAPTCPWWRPWGRSFVANVTLGECAQSDTAYVTWWPTPTVGSLPDSVSRCVLDAPYSFVWPTQTDDPVGTWIWSVNNEGATADTAPTTRANTSSKCATTPQGAWTPTRCMWRCSPTSTWWLLRWTL